MCIQLKPLFSRHKGIGVQFTDEPTGNLDRGNSLKIMDMLEEINRMFGVTIIMVTHDHQLMNDPDSEFHICDGIVTRMEG